MKLRLPYAARGVAEPRHGYVLFAVLIVIVVLSLVAYRFTDAMGSEYRAAVRENDDVQAKAAAVSGLHYAAAVLADRDTFFGELAGNPFDNPDIFEEFEVTSPEGSSDRKVYFSIRAVGLDDSGASQQRFGAIDEGGKLNINSMIMLDKTGNLLYNALMQIPGMTADVADAIVDWVDADDDSRASGAESSYYGSLSNPYKAKNGPLNSLDELLLVKGVTPALLYGGDRNRNGTQDDGEEDDTRGWSDYLTVYGRELNVGMDGAPRIYINGDDLNDTYERLKQALGMDMATYIIAAKLFGTSQAQQQTQTMSGVVTDGSGNNLAISIQFSVSAPNQNQNQNQRQTVAATPQQLADAVQAKLATVSNSGKQVKSVLSLEGTQIKLPRAKDAPNSAPDLVAASPLNDPGQRNTLIAQILDKTTTQQAVEMVPRINVNTASREVLTGLANPKNGQRLLQDEEIQKIIDQRANQAPDDPATLTGAWLLTTNVLTSSKFQQVQSYLTGSTMVYRVQAIGYTDRGGPVSRMEAVIDTNQGAPRFLHIRDLTDLENPRGFQPQQNQ